MPTSGRDLRLSRVAADLTVIAVADRMGLSRQALWALERSAIVRPERADQYRAAVRDLIEMSGQAR